MRESEKANFMARYGDESSIESGMKTDKHRKHALKNHLLSPAAMHKMMDDQIYTSNDLYTIAMHHNASSDVLEKVLYSPHKLSAQVACNPNISPELHQKLLHPNQDQWTIGNAINHSLTTADDIEKTMQHPSEVVRHYSAGSKAATTDQLHRLSKDPAPYVREAVAQNPNTSSETMNELANDKGMTVHLAILASPNLRVEHMHKLYDKATDSAKLRMMTHPLADNALLARGKSDPSNDVKNTAEGVIRERGYVK